MRILTIPDQDQAQLIVNGLSSDGAGLEDLVKQPLAQSERGRPTGMDHIHLSRFDGTDYCQWYGRCSDGYHRPIGRIMEIIEVKE